MIDLDFGLIKKSIMSEVAEEIRKAAGLSRELKPSEMIYWLKRIIYLPQGHASSENTLNLVQSNTAVGILPEVVRGVANSVTNLNITNFTSATVGALQEE